MQDKKLGEIPYAQMKAREIFKSAICTMSESCIRIIQAVGESLKISPGKTIVNIQHTGNTSFATIPVAFGAGLTYGAAPFTY